MSLLSVFTLVFLGFWCVTIEALPSWRSYRPQGSSYHHGFRIPVRPPPRPLEQAQSFFNVNCLSLENEGSLHPHPFNCNLYLKCVHGFAMERPCAPGTEFSPSIGVCVHSWQSDCGGGERDESGIEVVDETTESNVEDNLDVFEKSMGSEQLLDEVKYHKELEEFRSNEHSEEQETPKQYEHQSIEQSVHEESLKQLKKSVPTEEAIKYPEEHTLEETSTITETSITETLITLKELETHKNRSRPNIPGKSKASKLSKESEEN